MSDGNAGDIPTADLDAVHVARDDEVVCAFDRTVLSLKREQVE